MGDRFGELVAEVGPDAKVAVVSNALDFIPMESRREYARTVFDPVSVFQEHGLVAADLDLRNYFGRPHELAADIAETRLIWASGGNAFLLRRAMRQSGFDAMIPARIAEGSLVYAGWSAGAVVAGPSLRGLHLMDDPEVMAEGYETPAIWEGLGLIDKAIVPHFQSDHDESEAAESAVAWLTQAGLKFHALRDGEVLVV
jgi:dipeptidase E